MSVELSTLCRLLTTVKFSMYKSHLQPFLYNTLISHSRSPSVKVHSHSKESSSPSPSPSPSMETPSSTRRLTRSQTRSALPNSFHTVPVSKNAEEAEKKAAKSRPKSALFDITNDSPIVGLAGKSISSESKTPSSAVAKRRRNVAKSSTPGSGEALLRGQVKTLLQKVEEEAEISRFLGSIRPQILGQKGFSNSPMAPAPANTPQISGSEEQTVVVDDFGVEFPIHDHLKVSQIVSDLFDVKMIVENRAESDEKNLITRSLLVDFSEKSTEDGEEEVEGEEEDASVWSIQVNASTRDEEEEDIAAIVEEEEEEEEEEDGDDGFLDEICAGMSKISMGEVRFEGKHTRFVYNSKGEIEKEEEVVHFKGLPSPQGKHLRFGEEDE